MQKYTNNNSQIIYVYIYPFMQVKQIYNNYNKV